MKYSIGILTIALIATSVLSGCDRSSNRMENAETSAIETSDGIETTRNDVQEELRIYRTEAIERIEEFNQNIEEIKQEIDNETDADAKERLEKKLNELEDSNRELKSEMDDYKASGREDWEDFKDSFSNKMDDIGDSLDEFFSSSSITSSIK